MACKSCGEKTVKQKVERPVNQPAENIIWNGQLSDVFLLGIVDQDKIELIQKIGPSEYFITLENNPQ